MALAMTAADVALQAATAALFYASLIVLTRFAGKRLSGQTTNFDLIVLITMGVVLQTAALSPGPVNALVFVVTVFTCHKLLSWGCVKSDALRHLVRGKARVLVRDGRIDNAALQSEGIGQTELLAGLRKLGHDKVEEVALATLEETGQISAVAREGKG
jgi:uncharacterized membrane protein YcaP (DUF421 family)